MKIHNKIVKVDIDGVLRDMVDKCLEIYNERFAEKYGELDYEDITDYNIDLFFKGIHEEEGMQPSEYFFNYKGQEVFLKSRMFFEAKHAIDKLRENGFHVVIVSYQFNDVNKMSTLQWLSNNGIVYDDICFTNNKWLVKANYMIDDNPHYLFDERDYAKKILIMQPYNRDVKLEEGTFVAEDIHEAVDYIIHRETNNLYC